MRAVIDTNVWVSALLTPHGHPAQVVKAFRDGLFEAVVSEPLLNEIEAVLLRPRIVKKYPVDEATVREYLALLRSRSLLIEITGIMKMCRDPHDDFLIEMALWGGADCIVSRDDDLKRDSDLVVQIKALGIDALSVQQFLDRLREESHSG